ncbi:MAG: Wzz/FepE/Etk N-terminal domain-containing protein [Pseudomonadota bacterium]
MESDPKHSHSDAIDLAYAISRLWARKFLILSVTFVAGAIAAAGSLLLPNIYRAEALLAPNQAENQGGLSALAGRYGALAGLAGVNLGGGDSVDKVALGLRTLQSRQFITEFIQRYDLLVPLMAAKGWDASSDELIIDTDLYDSSSGEWVREVSYPYTRVPSLQEAYGRFSGLLAVSENSDDGFVKIAIEFYSPSVAKQWTEQLVLDLNTFVQKREIAEAESAIGYLNEQIDQTPVNELRQVFYGLIEEQIKKAMLANVTSEYLFRVIDPAVIPQFKAKPRRSVLVLLVMVLVGFIVSTLVLVWRPRGVRPDSQSR